MDNSKYEKYVICPDGGYYTEKFRSLAKEALLINPKRSFMNLSVVLRVARFVKNNKIDIIHTMLYTSDFCGIAAKLIAQRPKVINTINGFNFLTIKNERASFKRKIGSFFYRFIYFFSDKLIAVSDAVKHDLVNRRGIKTGIRKVSTILAAGTLPAYDNFSIGDANELRAGYARTGELVIVAIGTLLKIKDYDTMLEAFRQVLYKRRNTRLLIAGGGTEMERLKNKALLLGVSDNVSFLGAVDEMKKNALLRMADIYVISSRSEGCPTAVLEAMYFAKPIVATAAGGIPEIIENDKNGLLVPIGGVDRLAGGLLDLLNDENKRIVLGKAAKEDFEKRFSNSRVISAYESIYENVLTGKGRA